ncbi:MAG: S41 family peptidase [Balneolaceae bacterium]
MKRTGKLTGIFLLLVIFITSVAFIRNGDLFFQIKKQITIFNDVFREVATQYVDEVEPQELVNKGINAMLESLDPYTVFINEGEQQQLEILSSGSYGGIGLEAGYRGDEVVIIAPMDGYPADRAGLRSGDVIVEINGLSVQGMTPEEIQQLTIGDIGTEITIVIKRRGIIERISYTLIRERIEVKNINFSEIVGDRDQYAFIHLSRFGQQASEEVRRALIDLNDAHAHDLEGLILDLRNNPGGLLNEAVELVDLFIEPGVTVVETRGRHDSHNSAMMTTEVALFENLPIVLLINEGSASASEVVAGAFQDLDRAVIVGENSFGKGLVQTIRPLSYNTSLKMTISRYYIPSGRSIQSVDYTLNDPENRQTIPDSLRRAFRTKNGRVVLDGRGIEPDIIHTGMESTLIDLALQRSNQYLFFVNDILLETDSDNRTVNHRMPDRLFQRFATYLIEQNFSFETPVDRHLNEIEMNIDNFSGENAAKENLDELKALLRDYKISQIYENQALIERNLQTEWITQTLDESERNRALIAIDGLVIKAAEILSDDYTYQSILRP